MLNLDILKQKVFEFDGLTLTVGAIVIVLVLVYLIYWKK